MRQSTVDELNSPQRFLDHNQQGPVFHDLTSEQLKNKLNKIKTKQKILRGPLGFGTF